jgi:hypothetical protein
MHGQQNVKKFPLIFVDQNFILSLISSNPSAPYSGQFIDLQTLTSHQPQSNA